MPHAESPPHIKGTAMILGILQTGHVPDEVRATCGDYTALYGAMFPGRGYELRTFSVCDGAFPNSPAEAEAWLVTGSRHGAYEDHDWIAPLERLIREIAAAERPLIGVCFGHQIVAQALGGKVEKFAGGWSVGRRLYEVGGHEVALNAWHQDQVTDLPPGARVLGTNAFTANAMLAIGPSILTIQPHPEFGSDVVAQLIDHRSQTVPEPLLQDARAALDAPNDNRLIHDWIAAVIEGAPAHDIPFAREAAR